MTEEAILSSHQPRRYEYFYKATPGRYDVQAFLDKASERGWKLIVVAPYPADNGLRLFFERPVSLPIAAYLSEEGRALLDRCVEKAEEIMERHKGETNEPT